MNNFTTRNLFLFPSFTLDEKEQEKLDRFLIVLDKSGVADVLDSVKPRDYKTGGRPSFNHYDLFATILYGFAFGSGTLRDLESACRYDLRYIYLMQQERPDFKTFGNYINEFIVPNQNLIFSMITKTILSECAITIKNVFIDGTKLEANSNKYKFVWKPTTFHIRLCGKVRALLKLNGLDREIPEADIFSSKVIAHKLSEFSRLLETCSIDDRKKLEKQHEQLESYLSKALEYEEKERICGPDRKSYYKTDHDATAMALKSDYYSGLGSSMHAAYNVQIIVSSGFVVTCFTSQSRSDIRDFIPTLLKFYQYYDYYPENVCADAGYGSFENYEFLELNNMKNYVKHSSWQGNVSGRNPSLYRIDDGILKCLSGNEGTKVHIEGRHPRSASTSFYRIEGCNQCEFRLFCKRFHKNKDEDFRIFEVNEEFVRYKQESETNLLSAKGIEMRVNRSTQVEGAFGVLKQDMGFTRFRRRSLKKVGAELMLTFLGYNIRKLFRFFDGNLKKEYWKAPDNLKLETFKKPSAKRLSNKASKKKSANQQARDSYKY